MRRGGIITARRRLRERGKRLRRCAMTAGLVLLLCALAMTDQLKDRISDLMESGAAAVGAFAQPKEESVELTLEEIEVYALQLGVFDSGERALSEQQRLLSQGVPCVVWQRDKMRLICSVALRKEGLDTDAAGGNDAYIVRDMLNQVRIRLSCAAGECEAASALAALPDRLLCELLSGQERPLEVILAEVQWRAEDAISAHPENQLYTKLAESLLGWHDAVKAAADEPYAKCFASVLLCTLCREWRNALSSDYSLQAESTASAQRTPSTAAEVMPPA